MGIRTTINDLSSSQIFGRYRLRVIIYFKEVQYALLWQGCRCGSYNQENKVL